jgi:hypothetical protein
MDSPQPKKYDYKVRLCSVHNSAYQGEVCPHCNSHKQPPLYPFALFDGTLVGEFAERCTKHNHLPRELFIESFLTVLGAVVGDRLYGDLKGMEQPRQYTLVVAPPQSGKDDARDEATDIFRGAEEFDTQTFYTHGEPTFNHIGVKSFNGASEAGVINAGLKCKRLIATPPEFGSLTEKTGVTGSGNSLLETFLNGWDSAWAKFSTTSKRTDVPERLLLSLLTSIQPDRLQTMHVTSGLFSRIVWVTYPPVSVVATMRKVDRGDLQKRLFDKLLPLEDRSVKITTDEAAITMLDGWLTEVKTRNYEDVQIHARINIIVLRRALKLAWLKGSTTITDVLMKDVIQWGDWQLNVRQDLFLNETDNPVACMEEKLRKALRNKGPRTREQLKCDVNARRAGIWLFDRAVANLMVEEDVIEIPSSRRNTIIYKLTKEKEQ